MTAGLERMRAQAHSSGVRLVAVLETVHAIGGTLAARERYLAVEAECETFDSRIRAADLVDAARHANAMKLIDLFGKVPAFSDLAFAQLEETLVKQLAVAGSSFPRIGGRA